MAETARRQTTDTIAKLYDGKLSLERRNGGSGISARTFLQGKLVLKSTGETTLHAATKIATDWYLDLRDRTRRGEHLHGRAFAASAEAFLEHADQVREVSEGQRRNYRQKWALLKPHFEGVKVTDVDTRFLLALRETRSKAKTKNGQPVKPATLKKDMDFVRLVLKHAKNIEKNLSDLPEFPSFRGEAWEVIPSPRPFLDHEQWVRLRKLGKARIAEGSPESAHAAPAAGAVLVHADIRRRRAKGRGGVFAALARLRTGHAERQGQDRGRPHEGSGQAFTRRPSRGSLRHVRRRQRLQGHAESPAGSKARRSAVH